MKKKMGLLGIFLLGGIVTGIEEFQDVNTVKVQEGIYAGILAEASEYMAQQGERMENTGMMAEPQAADNARTAAEPEKEPEEETAEVTATGHEVPVVASEYTDVAIAQVNNYVNVRALPDTESEILGKLYNRSAATVLETTENGWYHIKSGSVEGYVKSEYVVVGDEELARSVGTRLATVTTTTLFVRSDATTEARVLTMVPEGDDLLVQNEPGNGWIQVATVEGDGYVSVDYVTLSTEYVYAESKAEEEARLAREEAERQAAAKAAGEARKAREEEARRAREAETKKAKEEAEKKAKAEAGKQQSAEQSPLSSENTGSVSNGQAVVNYGMQFLGNPYVFGGTSLTNGIDCSAFVQKVYGAFGISLPRNSAAQRSAGYGVSVEKIQPGDIVCYSGHVGIYAGNNTLLHASNEKTGITLTSPITYRKILAVRRIF